MMMIFGNMSPPTELIEAPNALVLLPGGKIFNKHTSDFKQKKKKKSLRLAFPIDSGSTARRQ